MKSQLSQTESAFRINQMNDHKITLHDIVTVPILFSPQFVRTIKFCHAKETLCVITTAAESCFDKKDGEPSATSCVIVEAASVVLLNWSHLLQTMRDHQKARDVVCATCHQRVHCITRHDGCVIAETEVLMIGNLIAKVSSTVLRNFSFVAVVRIVMNL